MEFDEYQDKAAKYDLFAHHDDLVSNDLSDAAFVEKILGLAGEAGEENHP